MKNESIYLVHDQQFTYRDSQMPTPGDKDVVVEIRHIGVCGSDVAFFTEHTMHGALDFELPIILGHECAGVVVQTGAASEGRRPCCSGAGRSLRDMQILPLRPL